jgi:tetratricopeptide (TPR) repeat protein
MRVFHHVTSTGLALAVAFLFGFAPTSRAQEAGGAAEEIKFIEGLLELRLPEYAELAVQGLLASYPSEKKAADLLKARISNMQGRFEDVQKAVGALGANSPEAQGLRLEMATSLYSRNRIDEAVKIFDEYFKQFGKEPPKNPALLDQYLNAALVLAKIREREGDFTEAIASLQRRIAANKDSAFAKRLLRADVARLYLELARKESDKAKRKPHLDQANKIANELTWELDLAFGKGIVVLLQAAYLNGDTKKVEDLILEYTADLESMDQQLKEAGQLSQSPLAGARIVKGEVYLDLLRPLVAAKKKEEAVPFIRNAAKEFLNVYLKYQGSDWESLASTRYNEVLALAEKLDIKIKPLAAQPGTGAGPGLRDIVQGDIRMASDWMSSGKIDDARDRLMKVLNEYPETALSPQALGLLARAFALKDDHHSAGAVISYLGERFARDTENTPREIQRMGQYYFQEAKNTDMTVVAFRALVDNFPTHSSAPSASYFIAESMMKAGRDEEAMGYFNRILTDYKTDKVFARTVNRLAQMKFAVEDFAEAAKYLSLVVENNPESLDWAKANKDLGTCLMKLGEDAKAAQLYVGLIKALDPARANSPYYGIDAESAKTVATLLEEVMYFYGVALSRAPEGAPDRVKALAEAVKAFADMVAKFPKSDFAPKALFGQGRVQIITGKVDEAVKTFEKLAKDYPKSEEGQSAWFSLARAAFDAGKPEVAQNAVQQMLATPARYTGVEFVRVGLLMVENKMFDEAERCFKIVSGHDDAKKDPAIGQSALYNLAYSAGKRGNYQAVLDAVKDLMTLHPTTGFVLPARLLEAAAHRGLNNYQAAEESLRVVFEAAPVVAPQLLPQAEVELAEIKMAAGLPREALGALLRVALTGKTDQPEARAAVRVAMLRGIEVARSMDPPNWRSIAMIGNQFLEKFTDDAERANVRRAISEAERNTQASP